MSSSSNHGHLSVSNIWNAILLVLVAIPSTWFTYKVFTQCPSPPAETSVLELTSEDGLCSLAYYHPILTVNILYFLNVNVLFWIISLAQSSTWLIDPYWTIIPVMISHFYYQHPVADQNANAPRAAACMILIWIWALRLQHSYFRRENFKFGEREDWRFTQMRKDSPTTFPYTSFFLAYVSQQPELVGLTLPIWAVTLSSTTHSSVPFGVFDILLFVSAVTGVTVAYFADTQLRNYMLQNEAIARNGGKKSKLLNTGVWYYSRHPNYFGEQLFWWSLAGYGVLSGQWWTIFGTVINSIVLAVVTSMVETRMLKDESRRDIYREYQRTTSVLIPLPKFSSSSSSKKSS